MTDSQFISRVDSSSTPPRPRTFTSNEGLKLVGGSWGNPAGPPVLFLHGGGQTRHSWGGTAAAVSAEEWYCLTMDARGHGDSDWSPMGKYQIEHFVSDLDRVLAELNRPAVLVGASLGGITALLEIGEAKTPFCAALVLVDITPKMETEGVERIRAFMRANPDGFASLEEAADAVAAYRRHRARPARIDGLRKNLRLRENGKYYWHWDPKIMSSQPHPDEEWEARMRSAARGLNVPTFLIRGKDSDVVSEEGARQFLDDVPSAEFLNLPGTGHMAAGDRNDVFTQAILDFLARNRPRILHPAGTPAGG